MLGTAGWSTTARVVSSTIRKPRTKRTTGEAKRDGMKKHRKQCVSIPQSPFYTLLNALPPTQNQYLATFVFITWASASPLADLVPAGKEEKCFQHW